MALLAPIDLVKIRSRFEPARKNPDGWDFYHFWLPVGVELERQLGFSARAVTIDNMTSRYLYVTNVGRFVAPYSWGVTLFLTGTQVAHIEWIAPPGVAQPAAITGQFAYVLFRSDRPLVVGITGQGATPELVLNPAAPTFATVGVASSLVVPQNEARTGLALVNTSANRISFAIDGSAAVLDSGITLFGNGGVWEMDARTFTTNAIRAIASGAGSNLAIQEFS